jgi:phage terminase large subunit-like protein
MPAVATKPRARTKRAKARPPRPFTIPHFKAWAAELTLDNGEPWLLEPFQESFLRDVFAGFPVCWLVVPEGNGKTTTVAGLALYTIEHLDGAYVPVAASSREQAEWIYRQAEGFVFRNGLRGTFRPLEGYRRIRCDEQGSRMQVMAADDRSGDGIIPGGLAILDELHRHKDLKLYRTWMGKLEKRNAQLVVISTAGEVGSEFELERTALRQGATKVARRSRGCFVRVEKRLGRQRLAVLHEWAVPEGGDIEDLALVKLANPHAGVTADYLGRKRALPGMTVAHWSRFTCNLASRSEMAAVTEAEWHAAMTQEEIPAGEPIWAGLDLGWKHDTTALVPLWIRDADFRLFGPAEILVPPRNGNSLDPAKVEDALLRVHGRNPIHTVVMDMTSGEQLASWIEAELGATVIDRTQSNAMAALDYARFMEALRKGWLHHTGDPGLTQHVLNAIARILPGGDARFDRQHASRRGSTAMHAVRVIDALIAAAMAHTSAAAELREPEPTSWRAH